MRRQVNVRSDAKVKTPQERRVMDCRCSFVESFAQAPLRGRRRAAPRRPVAAQQQQQIEARRRIKPTLRLARNPFATASHRSQQLDDGESQEKSFCNLCRGTGENETGKRVANKQNTTVSSFSLSGVKSSRVESEGRQ